jgi:hypothetical protein
MHKKEEVYHIIGYNIDSVTLSRKLANNGFKVKFYNSGKLGHPYDDIGDFLREGSMKQLKTMLPELEFETLSNSTYAMFEHSQLKFVNSFNGLISYPINKSSFESAEEQEQIEYCAYETEEILDAINNSKNYINTYKKFFPRWLYDSCIRHISLNKWHTRQSKLTRYSLIKEINLDYLDEFGTYNIYRPRVSYEDVCKNMLDHENIEYNTIDVNDIIHMLRKRFRNEEVILMDNRVDVICGYIHGNFHRVKLSVEDVNEPMAEEFINVDRGLVFTPMKEHFCATTEYGKSKRIYSSVVDDLSSTDLSIVVPTNDNFATFKEYEKLMTLYSGKNIDIGSKYTSVII